MSIYVFERDRYIHNPLYMLGSVVAPGIFFRVFITKFEYNITKKKKKKKIIIHESCDIEEFDLLL
jgi:hypothetical protein